jgi:UDP-N-acetylmuramoylalanine--D-glutamate ligase
MLKDIIERLKGKKILILGFGMEGRATYSFLAKYLPKAYIGIADKNSIAEIENISSFKELNFYSGPDYLDSIAAFDIIIKSPGIPYKLIADKISNQVLTSQSDLFLAGFANQTIGVTGTKGKSTTASLIYSILSAINDNVLLVGNIGSPPFDELENINESTKIVFELSSHQLENVKHSPRIGVLLNLFEEHLDHYVDYKSYQLAKFNIAAFQKKGDFLICNNDNPGIKNLLSEFPVLTNIKYYSTQSKVNGCYRSSDDEIELSSTKRRMNVSHRKALFGDHNLENIMAAALVCQILKVPEEIIRRTILDFESLPHRLEFIGKYKGVAFYNDSISTIPEATIAAIKTLKEVDILILGGYDRGIDYHALAEFLSQTKIPTIIYSGKAGHRIYSLMKYKLKSTDQNWIKVARFEEIENVIRNNIKVGGICLLSPAASSYDEFNSFKDRGEAYKKIAENI